MSRKKGEKIVYPPGVKELTSDISTDELYRRLRICVKVLQTLNQEEDNNMYIPLAYHLASDFFLEYKSEDICRSAALCIADIFRIFAPTNPYQDLKNLEPVFQLFIKQLKNLTSGSGTNFTDAFYLLENLAVMKTFNLCLDLQTPEEIIIPLFKQMFYIINVVDNLKVRRLILNMLSPLIAEGDSVSQELLELILIQLVEPNKSKNKATCELVQELIKQTSRALEPYIQSTFISVMAGQIESVISDHLYQLIYELNLLIPSYLIVIVNNLENKLLSSREEERLAVISLLSKLFADKTSQMIEQNKNLWNSYVSRYKDASTKVRCLHTKCSKDLLLNHPESSKSFLIECFMFNITDPDEKVRRQTCQTISEVVSKLYDILDPNLWEKFKERALDKNFEIRKTVLFCFGEIYQQWISKGVPPVLYGADFKLEWIKNKILYRYYGDCVQDKQLVEKLFITYIVPFNKIAEERMKLFYQLYCTIDEHALKALAEMIKTRNLLRSHISKLLGVLELSTTHEVRKYNMYKIIPILSVYFKDTTKANGIVTTFAKQVENNNVLRNMFVSLVSSDISLSAATEKYKEIVKEVENNQYRLHIRQVAARAVPIIDKECIRLLVTYVDNSFQGNCIVEAELGLQNSFMKGFELLKMLSYTFAVLFQDDHVYNLIMTYFRAENEEVTVPSLQILCNICNSLIETNPEMYQQIIPILLQFAEFGKPKQAKHSIFLLNKLVPENSRAEFFIDLMRTLQNHFTLESQHFKTALVSSGHIAQNWRHLFPSPEFKDMVTFIVTTVLMHDGDFPRGGTELWGPYDNLPDETKVKIEGMKCIVRWLTGKEKFVKPTITTLRCFSTYIENGGDLTEQRHNSPMENSWLRLSAACRMLKLCHVPDYAVALSLKQFQVLAYVLNDPCQEVCDIFAKKLNKALYYFKLPVQFLAVFAIGGLSERKDFKNQIKTQFSQNIYKRRQKLKESLATQKDYLAYLPEYSLPYAIHLLAHAPFFNDFSNLQSLNTIRDCLQMFMDCLIAKNEDYSFIFFKRLVENIKQTKDKQDPDDENMNLRLYAVCDLALNIILSQKSYVLKDSPAEPILNKKFFTDPDPSYSNMKTYLPPELVQERPVQPCFGIDLADVSKCQSSTSQLENTTEVSQDIDTSRSDVENVSNSSNKEESVVVKKKINTYVSKNLVVNNNEAIRKTRQKIKSTSTRKNNLIEIQQDSPKRKRGRPPKNNPKGNKNSQESVTNSRSKSVSLDEESCANSLFSCSSSISVNISDSESIKRLVKDCNVRLKTNEIELYTSAFPLRMNNVSPLKQTKVMKNSSEVQKCSLPNDYLQNGWSDKELPKKRGRKPKKRQTSVERETPPKTKKMKNVVSPARSLRSTTANSSVEDFPKTSSSCSSETKTNSSLRSMRSITSSIIKYAPKQSGAASVIVPNSPNNVKSQHKSKVQPNQSSDSCEQNNIQRNKIPVTRSNKIKSSTKVVNNIQKGMSTRNMSVRNKITKKKSRSSRR